MSEREEIQKRVRAFKEHQERLTREREIRMNRMTQQIRQTLSEMHARSTTPAARSDAQEPGGALKPLRLPVWRSLLSRS